MPRLAVYVDATSVHVSAVVPALISVQVSPVCVISVHISAVSPALISTNFNSPLVDCAIKNSISEDLSNSYSGGALRVRSLLNVPVVASLIRVPAVVCVLDGAKVARHTHHDAAQRCLICPSFLTNQKLCVCLSLSVWRQRTYTDLDDAVRNKRLLSGSRKRRSASTVKPSDCCRMILRRSGGCSNKVDKPGCTTCCSILMLTFSPSS